MIIKARVLRISKFVNTVHKHGVHDDESAVNSSRILRSPAQISQIIEIIEYIHIYSILRTLLSVLVEKAPDNARVIARNQG